MNLETHITDTIKEWQLKIGYREGNMKLYYPGESLVSLLDIPDVAAEKAVAGESVEDSLKEALKQFCVKTEPKLGRIKISGSFERFCLDIPAQGCAYVAGQVSEPEFLKRFLQVITASGSNMEQVRECFTEYASQHGTVSVEETEEETSGKEHSHSHVVHAFYFTDDSVEAYVYWVEENEFGLTYHRFTKEDYMRLK